MKIYVVYNYGQYNHLIHRTLRELGMESKLVENTTSVEELRDVDGLVIGGGPSLERTGNCEDYLKELDVPIIGICLGHQLMAKVFGGEVGKGSMGGYSEVDIKILEENELFEGIPKEIKVWASHMDEVKKLPEGFKVLAESDICKIEAMRHERKPLYGVQWHPEVYHSQYGVELYRNFIEICRK